MRQFALICLLLILSSLALAQTNESEPEPSPPVLPFRTYHQDWLRYTNKADGQPLLASDEFTSFAYRFVSSATALRPADFEDAELLASLLEAAAYPEDADEDAADGDCQTDKLPGALPDLFCAPGTSAMPFGHIFLALYHPETNEIAALTTTIDNNAGGATHADWSPTPEPAAEADGCGPYVPGQWITAAAYAASGLDLPVRGAQSGATDYQCLLENGTAYLQAYALAGGQVAGVKGAALVNGGGTNLGGGQPGGGDDGDGITYVVPINPPCTDPIDCDGGDGDE